jgi:hypothetical protein
MRKIETAFAAAAALGIAATLGTAAGATPLSLSGQLNSATAQNGLVEKTAYVLAGRDYCFYPDGWRGPGFYWCGYAFRRGYGWGGPIGWHGWRVGGRDGGSHGYVDHGLARERGGSVHGQTTGPHGRLGMQGDHGMRGERGTRVDHAMQGSPEHHAQAGGMKNLQNNATGMRVNTMNPGGNAGAHGGPAGGMGARGGAGAAVGTHGGAAGGAGEHH